MVMERSRPEARIAGAHRAASTRSLLSLLASASALAAGCAPAATDAPAPLAMRVRVPQITLDRLDEQLHLRVFERTGDIACDTMTGRLTGTDPYATVAGRSVPPHERCDTTRWAQLRMENGEATPVDTCFPKTGTMQMQRVPGGKTYIVLIEGSGNAPGPGGSTVRRLLGSGCATIMANAGQTVSVPVEMQEVADIGRCGDTMISSNEICDEGMPNEYCNARCRIPELSVATSIMGRKDRPSVAWAASQNMVIGFNPVDATDDPHVRMLDPNGRLITSPAILARDLPLDAMARSEQTTVRVAASAAGFAAVWQTVERTGTFDINGFAQTGFDAPTPQQMLVNPTTAGPAMTLGMINPSVAIGGTRVLFVWEDAAAGVLRTSSTTLAAMPAAPMADAPLVPAGMPGSTTAASPVVVGLSDGSFAAAWVSGGVGAKDIFVAKISSAGTLMGVPTVATTQTTGDQDQVAIATNGTNVALAWRDTSMSDPMDNSGSAVRWRAFSGALAPMGADRLAPTTVEGDQSAPTVAMSPGGTVLVAWQNAGGTIRGRLARVDGSQAVNRWNASTADFELNASADEGGPAGGNRETPSAAFGGTGRFAVAWRDGASNDIRVRVFIE